MVDAGGGKDGAGGIGAALVGKCMAGNASASQSSASRVPSSFAGSQRFQGGGTRFHVVAAVRVVVRVAEEKPTGLTRFGRQCGITDTLGKTDRLLDGPAAARRGGKTQHAGNAAKGPSTRPFLAGHAGEQLGRHGEPLAGGQPGIGALGALSGTDQPLGRPRVTRLLKVIGNGIRVGIGLGRKRLGSPAVPEPAARRQHALVERLAGQRVDEADARTIALRLQQVGLDRPFDDRQQRLSSVISPTFAQRSRGTS